VFSWPLIAVHTVLTPDGRVMSYGTDQAGMQTGYFVYDIWDATAGPTGSGHVTLPKPTNTDIFCSSQLVLPQGGNVFVAGGDNFVSGHTTNTGNNNSNLFDYNANTLTRGNNMNRERWYSSSTALLNGEIYIQGGNGGGDRPEIRNTSGVFRLLSQADTSPYSATFPRNFVAADGRVFGIDNNGFMYYVNTTANGGNGSVTSAGNLSSSNSGWTSSAAMFRPGRILQFGGNSKRRPRRRHQRPVDASTTLTANMSTPAPVGQRDDHADGRVLATGGSEVDNELVGVNNSAEVWNPATATMARRPERRQSIASTTVTPCCCRTVLCSCPAAVPSVRSEPECGDLLPLLSVRRVRQLRDAPDDHRVARRRSTSATHFSLTTGGPGTIKRVTLVKTGSDDAQLQHGPALHRAVLQCERHSARRHGARPRRRRARPATTCCSSSTIRTCHRSRRSCA
jgi:hypothetical protein